ncbi:MAG: superoxide dismutase [Eubacteriales bacterium]|nr:superoxide dismutase [Eubacteriales bacterium]
MNNHYKFQNPPLPYAFDALEPYIDAKTMELHHNRHLQTYIDNLNNILKDYPEFQNSSLEELIMYSDGLPMSVRIPVKNNAGGVYNHIFYFSNLKKTENEVLPATTKAYLDFSFESFENFTKEFTQAALSVFGSGYAWLVLDSTETLKIITTANQDTPLPLGLCPILNIDVWEHAYYLKHYNLRADYIKDWFRVINWDQVNKNLVSCLGYPYS